MIQPRGSMNTLREYSLICPKPFPGDQRRLHDRHHRRSCIWSSVAGGKDRRQRHQEDHEGLHEIQHLSRPVLVQHILFPIACRRIRVKYIY